MASWYVLEPPDTIPDTLAAANRTLFVRDGFSLGALVFGPFWLLWRRMWLVFLFWLATEVVLIAVMRLLRFDDHITGVVLLLFGLAFALEANALRAWTLRRKGWRFAGIAVGRRIDEAEQRHFAERTIIEPPGPARPAAPTLSWPPAPRSPRPSEGHGGVIGVFPSPQEPRP